MAIQGCNGGRVIGEGANDLANQINAINAARREKLIESVDDIYAWLAGL